jgi:hypothetical protein
MNKQPDEHQWIYYLETPRHQVHPVKIDTILHQRLQAFMNTKKIKLLLTKE